MAPPSPGGRRSLWRVWKQLSRFQRSLVYMFLGVTLVVAAYKYLHQADRPWDSAGHRGLPDRPREGVDEGRGGRGLEPPREMDKPWEGRDRPRNKVEAVHDVLESPRSDQDGAVEGKVQVADDEARNGAHEEDEYDGGDDDDDDDDDDGDAHRPADGDASNQAGELLGEADAIPAPPADDAAARAPLPPADGSLTFAGPQNARQRAVAAAVRHAWDGYKSYAWGHDHLRPLSRSAQNWFGLGLTIVDSLDTLLIVGMKEEFELARDWVRDSLDFSDRDRDVNLFETTIRVLGGLLSAHHLSGDRMFLDRAKDLGDRLMGAFASPSGVPYSDVSLRSAKGHAPRWSPDSSTSEVTTIQLEFRDLSRATGDPKYEEAADRVTRAIHDQPKEDGLVPIFVNANTGKLRKQATITLGARGDSYYEYLLKQWLQTGKTRADLRDDFVEAIKGVQRRLTRRTRPNNLLYLGEILSGGKDFKPKMDELTCFLPGTVALAVHHGCYDRDGSRDKNNNNNGGNNLGSDEAREAMQFAEELAYTCYLTFARQPTHLAAEITYFNSQPGSESDFYVKPNDAHYLLRPETVESFFYLHRFTGNSTYQDWGWEVFQGIEKYTKVSSGGYTTIGNVRNALDVRPRDMMESFLLGETFKYLYLLFEEQPELPLDRWVINTEAHPLPIFPN